MCEYFYFADRMICEIFGKFEDVCPRKVAYLQNVVVRRGTLVQFFSFEGSPLDTNISASFQYACLMQ